MRVSPRLILGTAQLCDSYGLADSSVQKSGADPAEFLQFAFELGITSFDTAPSYGASERYLRILDRSAEIHTKFHSGQNEVDSLHQSLQELNRKHLSLVYFHTPEIAKGNSERITKVREQVGSQVDHLGASEYTLSGFEAASEHPFLETIQFPINLLNLRAVREVSKNGPHETRIFARSVLGQGILSGVLPTLPAQLAQQYSTSVTGYARACSRLGRSMSEVALVWVRDLPWVDSVIIGPSSFDELIQLWKAWMSDPLSPDERSEVESHFESISETYDPRSWKP
jgi:aryl-alcohol dehydrogenase-like predicted oxidoreductase